MKSRHQYHWLYDPKLDLQPVPLELEESEKEKLKQNIRWALKVATHNGQDLVFDPDLIVTLILNNNKGKEHDH